MRVRWSEDAADDLSDIVKYIRKDDREIARQVAKSIYESANALKNLPFRGRTGRVAGTRELPLPPLPFILVYRVSGAALEIVNILHGAQLWPPAD